MDLGLQGKVVCITGGATGIGKASAQAFLAEGCKVAICGRSGEKLAGVVNQWKEQGYDVISCIADASKFEELEAFAATVAQQHGGIDIWINNAGIYPQKAILDMTDGEWDDIFRVNVKSIFLGAKVATAYMRIKGQGVILNASSFAALIPSAGSGAYGATKAAVSSLTRTLAAELAPLNIRVIAYVPGVIRTAMTQDIITAKSQALTGQIALGRLGEAKDVAGLLVFLASDVANYITGTTIEVSGGKFCVQNPQAAW
ncbi:MAG TPA: SDR family NAD(P)-dependent oxidoreductase [Negativicutes bacterium]